MTPIPASQSTPHKAWWLQVEGVYAEEKDARVKMMKEQVWQYHKLKASYRSVFKAQKESRLEALSNDARVHHAHVECIALKARHAAFEAQLEAKAAAKLLLDYQIDAVASALVSSAVAEAFATVEVEEVTRQLWQLKEIEDQEREAWLEEESKARQRIFSCRRVEAQRMLRITKLTQAQLLARREKTTNIPLQMSNLTLKEEVVRKRGLYDDEQSDWAELQDAMTESVKRIKEQDRAMGIIAGIAKASKALEQQQEAHYQRLRVNLKREEAAKRRFLLEFFADERVKLQKQWRQAETALWEQWAADQIQAAIAQAEAGDRVEASLERVSAALVEEAISDAFFEVQAEHRAEMAKREEMEFQARLKRDRQEVQASKGTTLKRSLSLRAKFTEVQIASAEHALADSPKCPRAPRAPEKPIEQQPTMPKPEKTGRRIYIRKQAAKRRQQEETFGQQSPRTRGLLLKQQAVDRAMPTPPPRFVLPPIDSPFNVQAPALSV
uniref:Uncharacterized protein n=1 Tax=Eutreptiella gymnastica TaxID=73025 RepID=A0A7S1NEP2_9EUGL|mmetsp:Transcript_26970/g.48527  ORF Transcript_26970/g.48527 Transcript_26970/m.48527 type:complete len:496 (+) Transcript_26970:94-1581(+)